MKFLLLPQLCATGFLLSLPWAVYKPVLCHHILAFFFFSFHRFNIYFTVSPFFFSTFGHFMLKTMFLPASIDPMNSINSCALLNFLLLISMIAQQIPYPSWFMVAARPGRLRSATEPRVSCAQAIRRGLVSTPPCQIIGDYNHELSPVGLGRGAHSISA